MIHILDCSGFCDKFTMGKYIKIIGHLYNRKSKKNVLINKAN